MTGKRSIEDSTDEVGNLQCSAEQDRIWGLLLLCYTSMGFHPQLLYLAGAFPISKLTYLQPRPRVYRFSGANASNYHSSRWSMMQVICFLHKANRSDLKHERWTSPCIRSSRQGTIIPKLNSSMCHFCGCCSQRMHVERTAAEREREHSASATVASHHRRVNTVHMLLQE